MDVARCQAAILIGSASRHCLVFFARCSSPRSCTATNPALCWLFLGRAADASVPGLDALF